MSAQRDAADGTAPHPPAEDPHGLLADTPFDSMREAERQADRTVNPRRQPRCPAADCGSINIRHKPGSTASDCEHKRAEDFRCASCGHHFDTPRPSRRQEELDRLGRERQVDPEPIPDETAQAPLEGWE